MQKTVNWKGGAATASGAGRQECCPSGSGKGNTSILERASRPWTWCRRWGELSERAS